MLQLLGLRPATGRRPEPVESTPCPHAPPGSWSGPRAVQTGKGCAASPRPPPCSGGLPGWEPAQVCLWTSQGRRQHPRGRLMTAWQAQCHCGTARHARQSTHRAGPATAIQARGPAPLHGTSVQARTRNRKFRPYINEEIVNTGFQSSLKMFRQMLPSKSMLGWYTYIILRGWELTSEAPRAGSIHAQASSPIPNSTHSPHKSPSQHPPHFPTPRHTPPFSPTAAANLCEAFDLGGVVWVGGRDSEREQEGSSSAPRGSRQEEVVR